MRKTERQHLLAHLACYKQAVLGINRSGNWWRNGKKYSHILPMECSDRNLIDSGFYTDLVELVRKHNVKKHLGFHHLNSSQALAINLFGPLVIEKRLSILSTQLKTPLVNVCPKFEHIEDAIEGTNFDFYMKAKDAKVFVEVKYTEDRFGSAKRDEYHREKYNRVYRNKLDKIASIGESEFFKNYQLWRNLWYSAVGDIVFVFPQFRTDLSDEVLAAREKVSNPERVKIMHVESICSLAESEEAEFFRSHYSEFRRKYLSNMSA